jgi:hypothetical protein
VTETAAPTGTMNAPMGAEQADVGTRCPPAVALEEGDFGECPANGPSAGGLSTLVVRAAYRLRRWSPAIAGAAAAFLLGVHDVWAIDLNLDQGLDEAGGEVKRYLRKGLQLFGLACCVIGLGYAGFKFSKKDHEAVWYLAGAAVGAAVFVAAGALLG